ncbi:hypothetical protein CW748_11155 [Alteromonadales bacterium alter-6D02]|nr:hypothetical protein CW748_11155 [Alteromonadales bacterium alter-6D02]
MQRYSKYLIIVKSSVIAHRFQLVLFTLINAVMFLILHQLFLATQAAVIGFAIQSLLSYFIVAKNKQMSPNFQVNDIGEIDFLNDSTEAIVLNKGQLLAQSFIVPWCCVLYISEHELDSNKLKILIWPDMVDDTSYRRLCRIIRLRRQQI